MAGVLKYWNGTAWVEVEIAAPEGPQGAAGPQAPTVNLGSFGLVPVADRCTAPLTLG